PRRDGWTRRGERAGGGERADRARWGGVCYDCSLRVDLRRAGGASEVERGWLAGATGRGVQRRDPPRWRSADGAGGLCAGGLCAGGLCAGGLCAGGLCAGEWQRCRVCAVVTGWSREEAAQGAGAVIGVAEGLGFDAQCVEHREQEIAVAGVVVLEVTPGAQGAAGVADEQVGDVVEGVRVALADLVAPEHQGVVEHAAVPFGDRRQAIEEVGELFGVPDRAARELLPGRREIGRASCRDSG